MNKPHIFAIVGALACFAAGAEAQISASNIALIRSGKPPGNLPFQPPNPGLPSTGYSTFDAFTLDWSHAALRLGFRYEFYDVSEPRTLQLREFSRRYATWAADGLEITVGNYETLFGRGLLLRAFELPGVIREEIGLAQYADSRDLDGLRLRTGGARWNVEVVQGKPRVEALPPDQPRVLDVAGATASAEIVRGTRAGANYVRIDGIDGAPHEGGGGFVQFTADPWLERAGWSRLTLDTYGEYAHVSGHFARPSPRTSQGRGYGVYVSQSATLDEPLPGLRWGATYEYKDYQGLQLFANEPPPLVREHSYALLNRVTHVVEPQQEQGYQFETRVDYRGWAELTLNWSRAENARSRRFHERYAELATHWRGRTAALFGGRGADDFDSTHDRDTFGGFTQMPFAGVHSIEAELERQSATRRTSRQSVDIEDRYASLTYAWAEHFSIGVVRQTTNDPGEATDPVTGHVARRAFDSLQASLSRDRHSLSLFWGRRRGGLACTAGTCYRVLEFEGVSALLVSRF